MTRLLFLYLGVILGVYAAVVLAMPWLRGLSRTGTSLISFPLILLFAAAMASFARETGRPIGDFGFTRAHLGASIGWGLLVAGGLCLLLVGIKAAWARGGDGRQLLELRGIATRYSPQAYAFYVLGYAALTLLQQFIARGVQSSLEWYAPGCGPIAALWLSTALFSLTHLHVSALLALAVFLPGLLWGWLYMRHPNLYGVTLSHMVVGLFAYFALDARLAG